MALKADAAAKRTYEEIIRSLKSTRQEAGLSQSALASTLPVTGKAVFEWEAGNLQPTMEHLLLWPPPIGDPTDIEIELGVGHRWFEEGWQNWEEPEWEAFYATVPHERHVMRVAQQWSICPLEIPEASVTDLGIYGFPPDVEPR